MHPIDQYPTIQRGLDELRRQGERERLARVARLRKSSNLRFLWRSVTWVSSHLVRRGQNPGHVRTLRKTLDSVPASPHH